MADQLLLPQWPAPAGVKAVMSTRRGGVSSGRFASMNLRWPDSVSAITAHTSPQDDALAVAENRIRLAQAVQARLVFLNQVHGARVLQWPPPGQQAAAPRPVAAPPNGLPPEVRPDDAFINTGISADACISAERGWACTVLVADCLPVLFSTRCASAVGAAHAGWRGLAAGVLENTVKALCERAGCPPQSVLAWLGPCIGPDAFEVGADVLQAFGVQPDTRDLPHFRFQAAPDGSARWRADLPGLARQRLQALGVGHVSGGSWCTVANEQDFYSFRRDGVTGRMAAAVALV